MSIDVFPQVVALLPLASYFILLGALRLGRYPLVTTATRDGAAVGIAASGLMMIGPAYLFFPSMAAAELGWYVWIVLGIFYMLCISLLLLALKPKIVIYGLRVDDAEACLLRAAQTIDPSAHLEANRQQIVLPQASVTLRVDALGITDAVQIEAFEKHLHPRFWRQLLLEVRREAAQVRKGLSIGGLGMLAVGISLMVLTVSQALSQSNELLAGFRQWLQV